MEDREERPENSVSVIDYLITIFERKKFIAIVTGGAVLFAIILSLVLPKIYRAETKIFSPQQGNNGNIALQIASQLGGMTIPQGIFDIKTQNDLYVELLKGRIVLDHIIDRFDLMNAYGKRYRIDARKKLLKSLMIHLDKKSGIITIGVEDRDPSKAADMANAFVDVLKDMTTSIAVTEAAQRRLFFETQLKKSKEDLARAEEAMKGFQESSGAIEIKEQAKALIESVAELRAKIASKEVELKVMRSYTTKKNPDLQKVEDEVRGMREQLARLEKSETESGDTLIPAGTVPSAGRDYIRRMRDMKYYETIYETMAKQYELARIEESKDAAVIQVLEPAVPPEKKIKPKRTVMVVIAGITGLFFSVIASFVLAYKDSLMRNPAQRERVERLKKVMSFRSRS